MRNNFSKLSIVLLVLIFSVFRLQYGKTNDRNIYNVTTWDAFGYYMYLPSVFIYHDVVALNWVPKIEATYHVTGGVFYQAIKQEDGRYTNKYLCGVSILQAPFFLIGHAIAIINKQPQDGFSWPYQFAIIFGALFWVTIGFVFLRKVLLRFFDDRITATTILLIGLCTNLIQYSTIDAAQSHVWIFSLYSLVLWFTIKWHEKPSAVYAILIGLVSGLAVIARPTELIIIFIPLLWSLHNAQASANKWALVAKHKMHVVICCIAGFVGVLPQLLYWHYTTGSFVYDVGSKWYFLNPWFRVLFGPEKGWFLYTPIAIIMVAGFVFMKKYPFQKSVITFCLLNLWVIMAWSDWRYGGSYSTRALVQSYPVFALALAALVHYYFQQKKSTLIYGLGMLFIILNFYQLNIYNKGVGEGFSPILMLFSK